MTTAPAALNQTQSGKPLSAEEQARRDFLATDSLSTGALPAAPKRDPEAHRGYIKGISLHKNEQKGTFSMKIEAHSEANGKDYDYYLPLPSAFARDITVDANALPTGTPDPQNPSKMLPGSNQRETYAIRIANSDGTGEAQRLRLIAWLEGKRFPTDMPAPANIEDWVMMHNYLLTHTRVVFTLKADANPSEPQFANVLKLRGFFREQDILTNPKAMKGYIRTWEPQR